MPFEQAKLIKEKPEDPSRRDFLRKLFACATVLVADPVKAAETLAQTNGQKRETWPRPEKPQGVFAEKKENHWIEKEIEQFTRSEEVKRALGFNPADGNFLVAIEKDETTLDGFAKSYQNKNGVGIILLNKHLYEASVESWEDHFREHWYMTNKEIENDERIQKALVLFRKITEDKEVLRLFRNLVVCHELSHQGRKQGFIPRSKETGHTFSTRVETEILKNLYDGSLVDEETSRKIIGIHIEMDRVINGEENTESDLKVFLERFFDGQR